VSNVEVGTAGSETFVSFDLTGVHDIWSDLIYNTYI
jgi:hypothetical protein